MSDARAFRLDRRAVRRAFARASRLRTAAPRWQDEVRRELLERLQFFPLQPRLILDLGCGSGTAALLLQRRFRRARVLAADSAYPMVRQARRRQRFWGRVQCVCADGTALPLAAHSVDLVFCNLMLQWCDDPAAVFAQVQAALRPGGLMLYSTLGPETLKELRLAWSAADSASHISAFADMTQLAAAMSYAGLSEPVMDRELKVTHHAGVHELLQAIRGLGAPHAAADRRRSLTGRGRWRAMLEAYESVRTPAGIPASWELIYGAGFAGGARSRRLAAAGAGEFPVPLDQIRPRGKNP